MPDTASRRGPGIVADIAVEAGAWPPQDELLLLTQKALRAAADGCAAGDHGTVTVLFTGDEEMTALNAQFRGKKKPTNVLSFPAIQSWTAPGQPRHIGDIALGYETIREEALSEGKSFEDHLTHLIVHGFLHLEGYDHETAEEADIMEALERTILKGLAIGDPYA